MRQQSSGDGGKVGKAGWDQEVTQPLYMPWEGRPTSLSSGWKGGSFIWVSSGEESRRALQAGTVVVARWGSYSSEMKRQEESTELKQVPSQQQNPRAVPSHREACVLDPDFIPAGNQTTNQRPGHKPCWVVAGRSECILRSSEPCLWSPQSWAFLIPWAGLSCASANQHPSVLENVPLLL